MHHLYQKRIFKKYALRLSGFGLFTTILLFPFWSMSLNVMWTFLLPVLTLWIIEKAKDDMPWYLATFVGLLVLFIFGVLSFEVNYSLLGYLYLLSFWIYFNKPHALSVILLFFQVFLNRAALKILSLRFTELFLLPIKQAD